jgi:hypothetical protein
MRKKWGNRKQKSTPKDAFLAKTKLVPLTNIEPVSQPMYEWC